MTNIIRNVLQRIYNNTRFYKTALKTYKNKDKLCIDKINYCDTRRILNPPTTFINVNDMQNKTIKMYGRDAEIKYLDTSHGIYVKLSKPVYSSNVETAFGFGCMCDGFDPKKIVYYPNYSKYKYNNKVA